MDGYLSNFWVIIHTRLHSYGTQFSTFVILALHQSSQLMHNTECSPSVPFFFTNRENFWIKLCWIHYQVEPKYLLQYKGPFSVAFCPLNAFALWKSYIAEDLAESTQLTGANQDLIKQAETVMHKCMNGAKLMAVEGVASNTVTGLSTCFFLASYWDERPNYSLYSILNPDETQPKPNGLV